MTSLVEEAGAAQEFTEARRVAQELAEANARLRLAMDAGRMAVWDVDIAEARISTSPELNRLLDFPEDATPSLEEMRERYMPGEGQRVRQAGQRALERGERYFEVEFRYRWRDGTTRWLQLRAEILRARDGMPNHILGVLHDITDRKVAEERLKLLAREVDHRANNLLAVVQATVKLSEADTPAELKDTIVGRIAALAHAHKLLADSRWVGADLKRLIQEEVKPYPGGKIVLAGPDVALGAEAAQSIAMVVHELVTNAVKYGALSHAAGGVDVRWALAADGGLDLRWSETGSCLKGAPGRRGFGVSMVERALRHLNGEAVFEWRREGVVCEIRLPADRLA